ncbi:hypothetical protein EX30DRAFT_53332 [Ascodesmis nigricans]|uniref:Uncharacterized protein n=1 Tax=Ascodesmis nigricans TaxID=341454 RepID=A0A4V6RHE4_9PEZI|nr:hypothetical protein EX30DRAFT_53332 [Ascodesmis nigricans]
MRTSPRYYYSQTGPKHAALWGWRVRPRYRQTGPPAFVDRNHHGPDEQEQHLPVNPPRQRQQERNSSSKAFSIPHHIPLPQSITTAPPLLAALSSRPPHRHHRRLPSLACFPATFPPSLPPLSTVSSISAKPPGSPPGSPPTDPADDRCLQPATCPSQFPPIPRPPSPLQRPIPSGSLLIAPLIVSRSPFKFRRLCWQLYSPLTETSCTASGERTIVKATSLKGHPR